MFEKLTDRNAERRLSLADARNHPWLKGKTFSPPELLVDMKDRIQLFSNICRKELEEKKEKSKWCTYKPIMTPEGTFPHRHGDPFVQGCISECQEINTSLEKQRNMRMAGTDQEKLSDDQVNSNSDEGDSPCKTPEDAKSAVLDEGKRK